MTPEIQTVLAAILAIVVGIAASKLLDADQADGNPGCITQLILTAGVLAVVLMIIDMFGG